MLLLVIVNMVMSCVDIYVALFPHPFHLLNRICSSLTTTFFLPSIALIFPDEAERARVMGHVLGGIALGVLLGHPHPLLILPV